MVFQGLGSYLVTSISMFILQWVSSFGDFFVFESPLPSNPFLPGGIMVASERWSVMVKKRLRYEHVITLKHISLFKSVNVKLSASDT